MSASEEHPVVAGLVALVGVGAAVGLLLGAITMVGTDMLGIDGSSANADATTQESLVVPKPSRTGGPSGPLITLAPGDEPTTQATKPKKSKKQAKKNAISLQAGQKSVGSMDRIDLSGSYQGGNGSILQVQRLQDGTWKDFPVTAPVGSGTYATYVQTGQTGKNKFRMKDSDSDKTSNPVTVTVN